VRAVYTVTIYITGHLRDLYPQLETETVIQLEKPATVAALIDQLGISSKMVLFATIDDRMVTKDQLIEQTCSLNLFSPPAGG
jgi:sulfur carrier protein ThiS